MPVENIFPRHRPQVVAEIVKEKRGRSRWNGVVSDLVETIAPSSDRYQSLRSGH